MDRKYDDIDPLTSWERRPDHDTLKLYIPGFKKEHLKVQVTSKDNLKIRGERPVGSNRWSRFLKEFPIPPNCDRNKITARFEGGTLYVNHPKIAPSEEEIKPPSKSQAQRTGQEQPAPQTAATEDSKSQDAAATTGMNKDPGGKVNGMEDAKAREKDSEKTRDKGPAEERKHTGAAMDTDKNLEDAAKREKTPTGVSSRKDETTKEDIKHGFGGLVMKMKQQPRKTMIVLMALLFLLLAVIYSRNTKGGSTYKSKN